MERPHFKKVAWFESLALFPNMEQIEWRVRLPLLNGRTYNPDYYDPDTQTYIEVCTSRSNVSEQGWKWREAIQNFGLRVFWWTGQEITTYVRKDIWPCGSWKRFAQQCEARS